MAFPFSSYKLMSIAADAIAIALGKTCVTPPTVRVELIPNTIGSAATATPSSGSSTTTVSSSPVTTTETGGTGVFVGVAV